MDPPRRKLGQRYPLKKQQMDLEAPTCSPRFFFSCDLLSTAAMTSKVPGYATFCLPLWLRYATGLSCKAHSKMKKGCPDIIQGSRVTDQRYSREDNL